MLINEKGQFLDVLLTNPVLFHLDCSLVPFFVFVCFFFYFRLLHSFSFSFFQPRSFTKVRHIHFFLCQLPAPACFFIRGCIIERNNRRLLIWDGSDICSVLWWDVHLSPVFCTKKNLFTTSVLSMEIRLPECLAQNYCLDLEIVAFMCSTLM